MRELTAKQAGQEIIKFVALNIPSPEKEMFLEGLSIINWDYVPNLEDSFYKLLKQKIKIVKDNNKPDWF